MSVTPAGRSGPGHKLSIVLLVQSMKLIVTFALVAFITLAQNCIAQEYLILPKLSDEDRASAIAKATKLESQLNDLRVSREWSSGSYTIRATAISATHDRVRLRKEDNKTVQVKISKLSEVDKSFLESHSKVAKKADAFFREYGRTVDHVITSRAVFEEYAKVKEIRQKLEEDRRSVADKEAKFNQLISDAQGMIDEANGKERATWTKGNPIEITKGGIGTDVINQKQLHLEFKNLTSKKVSAVRFSIESFNDFGESASRLGPKALISQTDIPGGGSDQGKWSLTFQNTATSVKVRVDSVVFEDGTKWLSEGKSQSVSIKYKEGN